MPRRRSRSRRKNSGDKERQKTSNIDKEDDPAGESSKIAVHSSRRQRNCSSDKLSPKLSYIVESQEKNGGISEIQDIPEPSSKLHEKLGLETTADSDLETSASISDGRCNSIFQTKILPDKSQEVQNEDFGRLKSASRVSKGKRVFEEKKEEYEESRGMLNSNTLDSMIGKECFYLSGSSNTKDSHSINEKGKSVSSENIHSKNTQSSMEPLRNSQSYEEDARENYLSQNKNQPEVIQQTKMASTVDIPPEGTDDATRSCSILEDKNQERTRRQRRLNKSKDRGDVKALEKPTSADKCDLGDRKETKTEANEDDNKYHVEEWGNKDVQNIPELLSECKAKDETITKSISMEKKSLLTGSEENLESEFETKISVFEIKRRFSCHTEKSNEIVKLRNATALLEMEDSNTEDCLQPIKDHVVPGGTSGLCTTELYVSSVGGKESSSASFLSAAESSSSILVDEKSVKFKPKSIHSVFSNDAEKARAASEGPTECSDVNKMSVKQLKERLISSCSDILDKTAESKHYDECKLVEKCNSYDESAELQPKESEKEDFNVSVKERMETYKCQASKAYHNIQSFYIDQELPSVTSIKELQSSFNKVVVQPSASPANNVNRYKVKNINEDLAQMQSFSMKCKSCGKQVFFMERIMAEKAMWHKKCFRCKECQKQLTVENYKSQDGELYCQSHYMNTLKPKPTDETLSENSVIEEVQIPPLNLKPLFEKTQNVSPPMSPPISPPSVERSPKFLKRLAKFEGKYEGGSEDEEDDKESTSEGSQNSSPEKKSKAEDLESYLQEESRKKSASKETKSRKKTSSSCSPKSSNLHVHLKQFFEKSPEDPEHISTKKNAEGTSEKSKDIFESRAPPDVRNMEDGLLWSADREINWRMSNLAQGEDNESNAPGNEITHASFARGKPFNVKFNNMQIRLSSDSGQEVKRPEEMITDFNNPEYKVSVNELKESLNSCSNIGNKTSDERNALEKNNSDGCIGKINRKREIEDFNVSLKDKLESYKTQASKKTNSIQIFEDKYFPKTSIKELQCNFNKVDQPTDNSTEVTKKAKVNNINKSIFETQSFSNYCKACGKKVFFMERILAEKAVWHKNCFRCSVCQKLLTVKNYKSRDGELYCQLHYKQIRRPKPQNESDSVHNIGELKFISTPTSNNVTEKSKTSSSSSHLPSEMSLQFLKRLAIFDDKYRNDYKEENKNIVEKTEETLTTNSKEINLSENDLESISNNECAPVDIQLETDINISPNSSSTHFQELELFNKNLGDVENTSAQNILEETTPIEGEKNKICDLSQNMMLQNITMTTVKTIF